MTQACTGPAWWAGVLPLAAGLVLTASAVWKLRHPRSFLAVLRRQDRALAAPRRQPGLRAAAPRGPSPAWVWLVAGVELALAAGLCVTVHVTGPWRPVVAIGAVALGLVLAHRLVRLLRTGTSVPCGCLSADEPVGATSLVRPLLVVVGGVLLLTVDLPTYDAACAALRLPLAALVAAAVAVTPRLLARSAP